MSGMAAMAQPCSASDDPTHSPTIRLSTTQAGAILGTVSYMAPEQARGKVVDKRADIWAFSCVLRNARGEADARGRKRGEYSRRRRARGTGVVETARRCAGKYAARAAAVPGEGSRKTIARD